MSGPKTSKYTLTPQQRRILEEQRERVQRRAAALENIQRNSKRLLQIGKMFSSEKQVAEELLNRSGREGGFSQKIEELEQLIAPMASVVASTGDADVLTLEKTAEAVRECVVQAEGMVQEISDIAAQNKQQLQTLLDAAIDQGFSTTQATRTDAKGKMQEQLVQIKRNTVLPAEMVEEIDNVLSKIDEMQDRVFLKNYYALTVSPLIKRCQGYLAEYQTCHEEFEKLHSEYVALCGLYGYVAQEFPCTAASVEALEVEIKQIKETANQEQEQAYISECLDEVMADMGYAVLGRREVTKKSGKHFQNKLFTYGEGTAVNVTYSADGKIAMELGGIDVADRLPDACETAVLCDAMESFCEDFTEIEKRLLAKGVILADRISLFPPGTEYAQIINVSDYELKGEAERLQVKKQRKSFTKLKTRGETGGKV